MIMMMMMTTTLTTLGHLSSLKLTKPGNSFAQLLGLVSSTFLCLAHLLLQVCHLSKVSKSGMLIES